MRRRRRSVRSVLAEQVLAVVNPDTRLVRLDSVAEPYCERLDHTPGHLSTVQPGNFGRLCGWLRGTRNGAATEDQGHDAKAHVLVDARQSAGLDGDASLLENFPPHRIARVLVQFDDPAGQNPFSVVGALDGEHPAVLTHDRGPNADRMTREIRRIVSTVAAGHLESCAFQGSFK